MRTCEQKFPCACVADLVKNEIIERRIDGKIIIGVGSGRKEGVIKEEGRGGRKGSGIKVGVKEGYKKGERLGGLMRKEGRE